MARYIKFVFMLMLVTVWMGSASAQTAVELVAPNIFMRGIQLPQGVRYTAAFIKPEETAALRNISVEITLPADAEFTEMLVSRQVQFHVVRRNNQRQLTLIWQLSRLEADQPLDSFSFTLGQPLTAELEVYFQWQTEAGEQRIENFFELPPVMNASQTEAQVTTRQVGFTALGDTGVQVSAPVGSSVTVKILPQTFNPPPEYGALWWCSLLELNGLAPNTTAKVIVPLRRTLAPFTALALFQQQPDGSWAELAGQGVVTADGQYVIYTHPGGVVATGGPAEIQPAALPAAEIPIVEGETIAPIVPPPAPITDGSSNTIVVAEAPPPIASVTDGTSNTIVVGEVPPAGDGVVVPIAPPPVASVTDGSSNTIIVGEATLLPTIGGDGVVRTLVPPTVSQITDGTSNTIIVGEATQPPVLVTGKAPQASVTPVFQPTIAQITDGISNTIIVGEATLLPTIGGDGVVRTLVPPTVSQITDGSSNTIIIGEATLLPTIGGDGVVRTLVPPTVSQITDGSSNTIIIGEATAVPSATPVKNGNATFTIGTAAPTVTSSSIVISVGSVTQPSALVTGKAPQASATPVVQPTRAVTDGTSNTITVGQATAVPTTKPPTAAPSPTAVAKTAVPTKAAPVFSPVVTGVTIQPFGAGGARVEIVALDSTVLQCQAGQVNCTTLKRRQGSGVR